ncbi:MAG: ATP-binding cassette domain-containing protein [Methylococcales bacterium]|jgi:branched-chain amino acid transport system ATP-binding protein|nr:ATP-binding cassette domain-containing protein [Methylococcales bacterium]MBT7445092.1 ATP-binding cassette domain-containing protein [Methylococcales bacterium]
MTTPLPLLSVSSLMMQFGGILALNDVSFGVAPNSITALIGPNGAGKTTVFNCITGFYRATNGVITLYGREKDTNIGQIIGEKLSVVDFIQPKILLRKLYYKMFGGSHLAARSGVARTFQNIRLFKDMTSLENLLVAQHTQVNRNLLSGLFKTPSFNRAEQLALENAYHWLSVCGLADDANRLAGELPYGHQRRLEIARAMCTKPTLICLDEPAAGLNPNETEALSVLIHTLKNDYHVTVLLIEHDMGLVMSISDHVVVLDHGEVIAMGSPDSVKNDPAVISAYLGIEEEAANS